MKKLLISILLVLSCTGQSFALGGILGGVMGAGSCDSTPDAFSFTDETDVAADGGQSCGAAITVGGTNCPTTISATGDTGFGYKVNGGTFTSASGTVVLNDTVAPCVNRSSSNSTTTTATVTIGGVSDTYSVTTAAGVSYLVNESFDTASTPSGWTNNSATFPGGYMQAVNGSSADTPNFAATGDVYVTAKITLSGSSLPSNGPNLIRFMDSGGSSMGYLSCGSTGKVNGMATGGTIANVTGTAFSVGGTTYIKAHYVASAHTVTVWASTDRQTWQYQATSTGTASNNVNHIRFASSSSDPNSTWQWDDVRVSNSDIN